MLDQIMTADDLRSKLKDHNLAGVARAIGLNPRTLYRLRDGDPVSLDTRLRLTEYFLSK